MSETRTLPDPTDEALLQRVAGGDSSAFAAFYDRHAGLLFGLAQRILGNPADAEDIVQDAFLLVWERAASYDPRLGRPLGWVITLTRNRAVDRLRRALRREQLAATELPLRQTAEAPEDPAALSASGEASSAVIAALGVLPPEQRQAIELAFFGGRSQTEIASALDVPLGTIKARIRRGMLRLRAEVQAYAPRGADTQAAATGLAG